MSPAAPQMTQFRAEIRDNGLVHLIFDVPGKSMNVLSNAAIHELTEFTRWLAASDVRGVVIRSGKDSAFCAGADLTELGVAYEMIISAPPAMRFTTAFNHFFPLSAAIRAMETSGKPVAAVIAGLALGGGCELALGAHYRVLVDDPRAALGLPESLVGLLPGGGGTQRLPRLVGINAALPILLEGARLSGAAAVKAGLVDTLAAPGEEIAVAEKWLLSAPRCVQPWDREDWVAKQPVEVSGKITPVRKEVLRNTLGHYPAPLAILDCVEFGLPQTFEGAIRSEMTFFSELIQRPEPRNMIQTQFLGKTDYDRRAKRQALPAFIAEASAAVQTVLDQSKSEASALVAAGFAKTGVHESNPVRDRALPGYWIDGADNDARRAAARAVLDRINSAVAPWAAAQSPEVLRVADYAIVQATGYPAYLGGPFAFAAYERGKISAPVRPR
jgi:3-hydroxyacyl-CoA dehydrogenase / enoyl-CoA hydratase / 3-hydroxybutyryl-CoA epimerase